jgi:hypothetical protein
MAHSGQPARNATPAAGARAALVIGNSAYPSAPLPNGTRDAASAAGAFETLGFKVRLTLDADRSAMLSDIKQFARTLADAQVGLFYFSGHAMQIRGKNYLLPVDFAGQSEAAVIQAGVALDDVFTALGAPRVNVRIVLIDACRNNPFSRSFASGTPAALDWSPGLAQPSAAPPSTFVSYSVEPGKLADDGPGSHSPYTRSLLRHILEPGVTIEDIFKKVRQDVIDNTDDQQVPWDTSSLKAPFFFRERASFTARIEGADDDAFVLVNGRDALSWSNNGSAPVSVPLDSGPNRITVKVYNQPTFTGGVEGLGGHKPEGWHYSLRLVLPTGEVRLSGGEDVPAKDGPHHGALFTVATATIVVDPATGSVILREQDQDVWKR